MPLPTGGWIPNGLCSLFVCDIASFGDQARSDLHRHKIRTAFYEGLRRSFDDEGIPYDDCYGEDRGDGALLVVRPSVDTATLLTSLADRLTTHVRQHNEVSVETARMRLRVAVHVGFVRSDGNGLVGTAVNLAFRILEAVQLKELVQRNGADLALIASERVYDDVIQHGFGLVNRADYRPIEVRVKETVTQAWIRVPGREAMNAAVSFTVTDARAVESPDPPPAESGRPRAMITAPDPPQREGRVTILDQRSDLDAMVEYAQAIRQLHARHLRDQIVAELPLALATLIRSRRSADDRADVYAIMSVCRAYRHGLHDLLGVVRRFAGDSPQLDKLRRSIESLEQA